MPSGTGVVKNLHTLVAKEIMRIAETTPQAPRVMRLRVSNQLTSYSYETRYAELNCDKE